MAQAPSKLEKLLEKQRQLEAQISQITAREKEEERKKDTRRKILIGGAVLASFRHGDFPKDRLIALLDKGLTSDRDRALFDFLPDRSATPHKPETSDGDSATAQ